MLLKLTEEIIRENAFERNKEKPGLNLTLGFGLRLLGPVSRKSRKLFGPEIKYSNRNIKNKSAGPG